MVVATLRRARIAHMLAPLPRCATIVRPARPADRSSGSVARDVLVRQPVEAVTPHPGSANRRGSANACADRRLRAVERCVETRHLRQRRAGSRDTARIAARLCGCCSGRQRHEAFEFSTIARVQHAPERANARPPCTTRCPAATSRCDFSGALAACQRERIRSPRRARAVPSATPARAPDALRRRAPRRHGADWSSSPRRACARASARPRRR